MLVLFINRYYTVITIIVKEVIMAGLKKLMFLATVAGAAVAGVSYILKYKEYQRELEGDFGEFDAELGETASDRKYTELRSTTDEFVTAAKDTANSARGMASAAKEMIKDVASIITDNVSVAGDVAKDNAKPLFDKAKSSVDPVVDKAKKAAGPIIEKAKEKFDKKSKKEADEDSDIEVEFYEMDSDEDKKDLAQKIEDILESNTDKK